MRPILASLAASLFLATASAAQSPEVTPPEDDGLSLFERGAREMLRGLMDEVAPALDEMGLAITKIEPALRELARQVDDIRNYDAPRRLPNGDILIPRRADAPPPPALVPEPAPQLGPPKPGEIDI